MKIYMFDTETGLYLGQHFGSHSEINMGEGITDIAPPSFHPGQTPVFDVNTQGWVIADIDEMADCLSRRRLQRK